MKESLLKKDSVHQGKVTALTALPDGGFISASSDDQTYKFFGSDGTFKGWFRLHGCQIETVIYSSSGKLVVGTTNGCIGIYGKNSSLIRGVSGVHTPIESGSDYAPVKNIIEVSDGVLASCSNESIINVMKIDGECLGKYLVKIDKNSDPIVKMILLKDGTVCVGLQNSSNILIFDKQFQLLKMFKVSNEQLDDLIELYDGKICTATGSYQEKGAIKVWNTKGELEIEIGESATHLAELKNGLIASYDKSNPIEFKIWKRDGKEVHSFEEESLEEEEVLKMIALKDGNLVVSLESGEVLIWSFK